MMLSFTDLNVCSFLFTGYTTRQLQPIINHWHFCLGFAKTEKQEVELLARCGLFPDVASKRQSVGYVSHTTHLFMCCSMTCYC